MNAKPRPPAALGSAGAYELLDNRDYGRHRDALAWLVEYYAGPLQVATGYVALEGLDALAQIAAGAGKAARLLLGVAPEAAALTGPPAPGIAARFEQSQAALRRERDFSAFPASRRAALERVAAFIAAEGVAVRRYRQRFLHGKAYLLGQLNAAGQLTAPGAALVSSANLTGGGLESNLELGMTHYQPEVVRKALQWYERLWQEAQDFKEDLLELLRPPAWTADPQTIFLRALLELYGHPAESPPPSGNNLTDFQQDGYRRAKAIMERYGGVLYADGVGMGKTEIGLRFIREHAQEQGQHTLIIAPAQLRDRLWDHRLKADNLPGQVVSYQQLAQDRQLTADPNGGDRILPVDKDVYRLIVVDEAHAYRNAGNTWYRALDRLMGGAPKKLLLLTATPVNNSLWDLHNLFLLFGRHDAAFGGDPLRIDSLRRFFNEAGAGADRPEQLAGAHDQLFPLLDALTVRRSRAFVQAHYPHQRFADGTAVKFPEPQLRERRYDLDAAYPRLVPYIANNIQALTMARYRPTAYLKNAPQDAANLGRAKAETALSGLIQSQMLKRFESSWYAAWQTVGRMRDANEAVLQTLEKSGVAPPAAVIRELAGALEDDTDLSPRMVEDALAAAGGGIPAAEFTPQFVVDVRQDRNRLRRMAQRLEKLQNRPDPKLAALRQAMAAATGQGVQKVALFTAFRDTAEYLKDRIAHDPALLDHRRWTVVIGADTDAEARARELERFCPLSVTDDPDFTPPEGEVDALLSTDVLSEGQNLQQAQAVLSYDMPWNPQRVVQRNGRIIRLRSPHATAYLYTLLPEAGALDKLLALEATLRVKILAANAAVGMETPVLSQVLSELKSYAQQLSAGDVKLLEEPEDVSAFAGELFRAQLRRLAQEGELNRLQNLPWGIGAAFVAPDKGLTQPAVFFACRAKSGERYWRVVSAAGEILSRDDYPMLLLINPENRPGCPIPGDLDLERLFDRAAADICQVHNRLRDPATRAGALPAVQRWALGQLELAAPAGPEYNNAYDALSVGRSSQVGRELAALRGSYADGGISVPECADRIVAVVQRFGLNPVNPPAPAPEITAADLGVVCYQVVLPE